MVATPPGRLWPGLAWPSGLPRRDIPALVAARGTGYDNDRVRIRGRFAVLVAFSAATLRAQPECATCHADIAASYARTGMARTFGSMRRSPPLPAIPGGVLRHLPSAEFFSISIRDGAPWLRRAQAGDTNILEKPIDYWIGSGNHARSYLTRSGPILYELPISYYAGRGGTWAMSPAYDRAEHSGFSRRILYRCMFCHNAYPDVPASLQTWDTDAEFPEQLPEGIDCQRCHGPGAAHIAAAESGQPPDAVRRAIVNPARLTPERRMEVCLQCHLETTTMKLPASIKRYDRGVFSYQPGEPLGDYILNFDSAAPGDRFEFNSSAYRLRLSACFRKSQGALTCTTCHNPHDIPRGPAAAAVYARACQSCHTTLSARHPSGPDCAGCHMIKRPPSDALRVTVTDHYIRVRPQPGPAAAIEHNDSNTPVPRGEVVLYYPAETRDSDLYLAVAQVRDQANLERGIQQLEAAIARDKPDRGEFYLELAEAYRHAKNVDQAAGSYSQAAARSPADWRPQYGLGLMLAAQGKLDGADASLRRAIDLASRESAPPVALAQLMLARNRPAGAAAVLQRALLNMPESADLYRELANADDRLGDHRAADSARREAARLRPEIRR